VIGGRGGANIRFFEVNFPEQQVEVVANSAKPVKVLVV